LSDITIYHNPACGTSRNTLAMIRNCGEEPRIVQYLKTPPSREELQGLVTAMGLGLRDVLRRKGTPYDELGLDNPDLSDDQLYALIAQHPVLIQRPIVATPLGVRLCRPSEVVLEILPQPQQNSFTKEDGEVVIPSKG
jgi:arsenate reductase